MKKVLDRLEVLNKFADRISYNFLCFSGWVIFVVSCCFFWPTVYDVYVLGQGQAMIAILLYYVPLLAIALSSVFIALIILLLEYLYGWRIKNNFFLNNGFMKFLRYFGLVYLGLVLLFFAFILIMVLFVTISTPIME